MQNSKEKLIDFAALCLWIVTSIVIAVYVFIHFGQDFCVYYAAARILLERGNPYDYAQIARVLLEVTSRIENNGFYYPLWFGWFITPFSLLPFQTARAAWMIFNWAMWLIGLIRLQQLLEFPRMGWRASLTNLLATFIFAWTTWKFEQIGIVLFVIMVEILFTYKKQQWNRMGIFLGLALIKPNVMLLPVVALLLWLIRNRDWRPVATMALLLVGLVAITIVLTPNWYQPLLQPHFGQGLTVFLDGPHRITGTRLNTTLLDWLKWFSVQKNLRIAIYIAVAFIAVLILGTSVWKSKLILEVVVVSLLISFAITPYALQYDFPPLVIVLFWALSRLNSAKMKLIPVLIVAFIASVLIWEHPISDGYWIVIGLSVLTFLASKSSANINFSQSSA